MASESVRDKLGRSPCRSCSQRIDAQDVVLSFGKHKGKPIKQVDAGYLHWMQATLDSPEWRKVALQALEQRKQQQEAAVAKFDKQVLLAELKICSSTKNLERGKQIHAKAIESGVDSSIYVATALISMYARCGSMDNALQVFDRIKQPDVACWNALILGYAKNGKGVTALGLFARMKSRGYAPNSFTYVACLNACTSLLNQGRTRAECLGRGRQIHSEIGGNVDIYVQSSLIDMYAKCGSMVDARKVFDCMKHPNEVSWNALILGYAENGEEDAALKLFAKMKSRGTITFLAALKACASLALKENGNEREKYLLLGKQIHSEIGSPLETNVQNSLIDMYAKSGSMPDARHVFNEIKYPSVVSWNALILGYADNGEGVTSLQLFARMRSQGCAPDNFTFVAALKACTALALEEDGQRKAECLEWGKAIHLEIGNHSDSYVESSLIDMYSSCGSMADARQVFDAMKNPDIVCWTALILGYAENGESATALDLFARMRTRGLAPDSITFVAALKACAVLGALESGSKIHAEMDPRIHCNVKLVNCLVDFYAKCGSMVEARKVFDSYPSIRNLRTWTALLAGYSRLGDNRAVFALFKGMQDAGFSPDGVTFLCILTCCNHAGLVQQAQEFFSAMSTKCGIAPAGEHYNCMVDILGRSKKLDDAVDLLRSMPCRPDAVTWMTLLSSCRKWANFWIGRLAFESLDDANDAAAYVLMADLYGSRGMRREQAILLSMRKKFRSPGQACWTSDEGEVFKFLSAV